LFVSGEAVVTCVGIIANPASGKDIRRLVAHGSVFSNHEKVNIVRRILIGLDAMGIERVVTMPDAFDICRRAQDGVTLSVAVQELKMPTQFSQQDTTQAVVRMQESGADCMITLGGDGTNRAVAKAASTLPVLPVSTGTNNVFPYMIEGTLAGMAAAIVAQGLVDAPDAIVQRHQLDIEVNGEMVDLALVDAVICDERSVASRAVWDVATVRLVVVAQRLSAQIGFMALAGNIPHSTEGDDSGLVIETHTGAPTVLAPIAPGLIVPVGVRRYTPLAVGGQVEVPTGAYTIALDGERERKIRQGERVVIRLNAKGPRVVNPHQVLAHAAQQGAFLQGF
jgi:predicted polyphosphate/ATP-dependent NAD kinase